MLSSGISGLDGLLGGWAPGDNVVWLSARSRLYDAIEAAFLTVATRERPVLIVSATGAPADRIADTALKIDAGAGSPFAGPVALADEIEARMREVPGLCILFDGFGTLARRWGQPTAAAFFARVCPTMLQAGAITYWRLAPSTGGELVERIRQVTQCLLELDGGELRVHKAEGRLGTVVGSVHPVGLVDGEPAVTVNPTSGRLARGLRAVRADLGLTQAELAAAAGITPSAVSQAESGARGLSVDTLILLSDRLGVSLDRLVSGTPARGYQLARHDRGHAGVAKGVVALADDSSVGMRCHLVVLPGAESGAPPWAHKGVELIVVASGLVQVDVGGDTPVLRGGDSLLVTTSPITAWANLRPEPAAFHWIVRD
jgi:transcriptional regulator with XRE-family HTH domain